jgi:hypothetical protein
LDEKLVSAVTGKLRESVATRPIPSFKIIVDPIIGSVIGVL